MAIKLSKKKNQAQKIVKKVRKNAKATHAGVTSNVNLPKGKYFEGIGRRKVATARVRLYADKGDFIVNGKAAGQYFSEVIGAPEFYNLPLKLANLQGAVAVSVKVSGSGIRAQLDAVILGLSRALVKYDPELKPVLKKAGLMTRDDRMKETRKIGTGGKARRKRQSPKR